MKQFIKSVVTLIVPLWAFIMLLMYYGIFVIGHKSQPAAKTPADVQYFKQGDTLLPDMVCRDTLIVTDADGLNKGMALVEQGFLDASDHCIDSIIHTHCIVK